MDGLIVPPRCVWNLRLSSVFKHRVFQWCYASQVRCTWTQLHSVMKEQPAGWHHSQQPRTKAFFSSLIITCVCFSQTPLTRVCHLGLLQQLFILFQMPSYALTPQQQQQQRDQWLETAGTLQTWMDDCSSSTGGGESKQQAFSPGGGGVKTQADLWWEKPKQIFLLKHFFFFKYIV